MKVWMLYREAMSKPLTIFTDVSTASTVRDWYNSLQPSFPVDLVEREVDEWSDALYKTDRYLVKGRGQEIVSIEAYEIAWDFDKSVLPLFRFIKRNGYKEYVPTDDWYTYVWANSEDEAATIALARKEKHGL